MFLPMKIRDYRKINRLTQHQFAQRVGVTAGLVGQWERGETVITAERAAVIHAVTGGEVAKHELRPDLWECADGHDCQQQPQESAGMAGEGPGLCSDQQKAAA